MPPYSPQKGMPYAPVLTAEGDAGGRPRAVLAAYLPGWPEELEAPVAGVGGHAAGAQARVAEGDGRVGGRAGEPAAPAYGRGVGGWY